MMQTFVFDGTEVQLTGREAKREVKLSSKSYTDVLIEIQPVDTTGPSWKRWVKQTDLYTIQSTVET